MNSSQSWPCPSPEIPARPSSNAAICLHHAPEKLYCGGKELGDSGILNESRGDS